MVQESTEVKPDNVAQQAETKRDLRGQIGEIDALAAAEKRGILFKVTTLDEGTHTLYSMIDGHSIKCPDFALHSTLFKTMRGTNTPLWTSYPDRAPEWVPGKVKCFLHADSPDREALAEIGLSTKTCKKSNLGSLHDKRIHGQNKHKQSWEALGEYYADVKETAAAERQEQQLQATLELARAAQGQAPATTVSAPVEAELKTVWACGEDGCDYSGTEAQLRGHKSKHS